jgi:uncharacterized membrane protein
MNERAPWLLASAPLLILAISVPLALGWVDPNPFYGVRTAATQASDAAWYRANTASGLVGICSGLVGLGVNMLAVRSQLSATRKIQACLAVLVSITLLIVVAGVSAV